MKAIDEALDEMMPAFTPRGVVTRSLLDARGLFLAERLLAREDAPPFDASAMDGYALRAADLRGASAEAPVRLPVVGESRAGGAWPDPLPEGVAVRVFTGAPLPAGADTVVAQEDTAPEGGVVAVRVEPSAGRHVRVRGGDSAAGAPLFEVGDGVHPMAVALLASQGIGEVEVFRRPAVSILCSGDELRRLTDPPRRGAIVSSNLYALAALVAEAGGEPRPLPAAPDDAGALVGRVEDALRGADLVLTTGGVSVGDYDHVREALERAGVEIRFDKVRIKPGKPLTFGVRDGVPVVGLPGNPVSCFVTFEVFVRPGIRRMLGDPRPFPSPRLARLTHPHRRSPGRVELARGRLAYEGDALALTLFADQRSGALASAGVADALAILPADAARFEAGEQLRVLPLRARGPGASVSPFAPSGSSGAPG
jgi:molybdopterin molybdotransferase